MDYCNVFISCLDSHSDGTHSLQSIHWWASDVMLIFSKSVLMKKKLIYILHGLRVSICSANVNFWVNYSFKTLKENVVAFILFYPSITDVRLLQRLVAFPLSRFSVWAMLAGVTALLYLVPLHSCVFLCWRAAGGFELFHWWVLQHVMAGGRGWEHVLRRAALWFDAQVEGGV